VTGRPLDGLTVAARPMVAGPGRRFRLFRGIGFELKDVVAPGRPWRSVPSALLGLRADPAKEASSGQRPRSPVCW
jgi:hypothetical protein